MSEQRRSKAEDITATWLRDAGYSVKQNVWGIIKSPAHKKMELDIYIPDISFAVELDGSHYHREQKGLSYYKWQMAQRAGISEEGILWEGYHDWKNNECAKLGIKLYHIVSEDVHDFPDATRRSLLREIENWCSFIQ